jgi:flagellar L-ring protein FlgH
MKKICLMFIVVATLTGCASWFERAPEFKEESVTAPPSPEKTRTTRKSLEEESLLGESTGSLWVGRGQQAYLFTNNNQRLLGDLLNVNLEGYPKEQIQTKITTISKLLAEILGEQRQEIEFKQNEIKKQLGTPEEQPAAEAPSVRGLASTESSAVEGDGPNPEILQQQLNQNAKELKKISAESEEIAQLKKATDIPIKSVPTRIMEVQRDGNYRVRGEQPFMIGKREYKLLVMGTVRAEDFNEQGVSAEALLDPVFDIISDKKMGDL